MGRLARVWQGLAFALLGVAVAASCSRPRTSEGTGSEGVGTTDSGFLSHPCQSAVVDDFGWPLDTLEGIRFRRHPSLKLDVRKTIYGATYRARDGRAALALELPVGYANIDADARAITVGFRREHCEIAERTAEVLVGRTDRWYEMVVLWSDIGDGRRFIARGYGRTPKELQLVRAALFTMQFPSGAE